MRLIDADSLVNELNEAQVEFDEYYKGLGKAKVITDNAPTVEGRMFYVQETVNTILNSCTGNTDIDKAFRNAARFVQNAIDGKSVDFEEIERAGSEDFEPSKGKWVECKNGNIKCRKCGCEIRYSYLIGNKSDFPNFCCDCGADMREGGAE